MAYTFKKFFRFAKLFDDWHEIR